VGLDHVVHTTTNLCTTSPIGFTES
jgi:hypothetical protein